MIAKAQADSVCAFFGNVEINFTLRSVFTNLPDGEFRMHLGNVAGQPHQILAPLSSSRR